MIKRLLILTAVLSISMQVSAYNFELKGIYYNFIEEISDEVEVTSSIENRDDNYYGQGYYYGDIAIPETINYDNREFRVTRISKDAFRKSSIETLLIPKSVEFIGMNAFKGCSILKKIEVEWETPLVLTQKEGEDYPVEYIFDLSEQQYADIMFVVPKGSLELYKNQEGWKNFVNIVEATAILQDLLKSKMITFFHGAVELEFEKGKSSQCIGIQFGDANLNKGCGTYLEIRKRGKSFVMIYKYKPKNYSTIDEGLEEYIKDLIDDFYKDKDEEYGKKVWKSFVDEGGLTLFIEAAKRMIDNKFLAAPFNTTLG